MPAVKLDDAIFSGRTLLRLSNIMFHITAMVTGLHMSATWKLLRDMREREGCHKYSYRIEEYPLEPDGLRDHILQLPDSIFADVLDSV